MNKRVVTHGGVWVGVKGGSETRGNKSKVFGKTGVGQTGLVKVSGGGKLRKSGGLFF